MMMLSQMAKRDPEKTARNKQIAALKGELRALLPKVLQETGIAREASLNAKIGHKSDEFIDLKNEVINSSEEFTSLWLAGFKEHLSTTGFRTSYDDLYDLMKGSRTFQEYLYKFLRRSYLNHYEELSKTRPSVAQAEIWIGQNHADYGLLVTPRFGKKGWENDKSEIRHFRPRYWSIGHVLESGLVIPDKNKKMTFQTVEDYLKFFEHVLVRGTASSHQKKIAELYCDYVRKAEKPLDVPLLIPELRYDGRLAKHKYRLDFCIIDPGTMNRIGFELSPWSTHGLLTGTKGKTQKQINEEASANFDKEMKKHKDFFRKHDVFALIYTDADLKNIDGVFVDIAKYLKPKAAEKQLKFQIFADFFSSKQRRRPASPLRF
jgi:hypothetical protein